MSGNLQTEVGISLDVLHGARAESQAILGHLLSDVPCAQVVTPPGHMDGGMPRTYVANIAVTVKQAWLCNPGEVTADILAL